MMLFATDGRALSVSPFSWPRWRRSGQERASGLSDRGPSGSLDTGEPEGSRSAGVAETNGTRHRFARLAALVSVVAALSAAAPAFAGASGRAAPPDAAPAVVPNAAKPAHEPGPRRLSKFEARKIRHVCYGRANERGLSGGEREAFLSRCYFGRVSYRVERQQCRQQAAAKGIDKATLRDFMRECVKERVRQKDKGQHAPTPAAPLEGMVE